MRWLLATVATFLPAAAFAGSCDSYVKRAASVEGEALVTLYERTVKCSAKEAHAAFETFMVRAGDVETLVPLALVAIRSDGFVPVWNMMERVPYGVRDDVAEGIGATCAGDEKVLAFLQGGHAALKGHDFTGWVPAYASCADPALVSWIDAQLEAPPSSPYSEKYNGLLTAVVSARGVDALPALETSAVAAGKAGGPFGSVLDAMQKAIAPESLRDDVDPAHQAAFEDALVRIAQAVPPEAARLVADRLYSAGATDKAAKLLPALYPDRVQPNGEMLWVGAAVEQCEGEAVVHWTSWTEAPTRMSVVEAVTAPLRATKGKLKCDAGEWPVKAPDAPVADDDAASAWVDGLVAELEAAGVKAKPREEKKLAIQ